MPYRITPFDTDSYYHVFNRGVEKRQIFLSDSDYQRFFRTLYYYQFSGPKPRFSTHKRFRNKDFDKNPKIVEVICYCLMPNHFHLLLKQLKEGGIQEFMSKITNSYSKYFNTKQKRVGHLLQGQFKAVSVETDEQLVHLSRYIHLNPFVADITKDWEHFPYSSIQEFTDNSISPICKKEDILIFFKSPDQYLKFIADHQAYAQELHKIQHILIDEES